MIISQRVVRRTRIRSLTSELATRALTVGQRRRRILQPEAPISVLKGRGDVMTDTPAPDPSNRVPTGAELTALDPAFRADPYPVLARLRGREPVHYDDVIKRWVLTRGDDIERVLRDRTMAVDARKANPGTYMRIFAGNRREPSMLMLDAPDHTRLRSLVNKAFTPRAVEELAPRIRQLVDALLEAVSGQDGFDLIEAFAGPLPVIVIAEMLGVNPADREAFQRWSHGPAMVLNPLPTEDQRVLMSEARKQLDEYLRRAIAERRADPRDDLISAMIAAEEAGDQLNDQEIVTMCGLLLAAGNVTTTDLIGNGVWALLRHPDQLQKLRDDPSLIRNAVEEVLRLETPVVQTARIPMNDLEIDGCPVKRDLEGAAGALRSLKGPDTSMTPDQSPRSRSAAEGVSLNDAILRTASPAAWERGLR